MDKSELEKLLSGTVLDYTKQAEEVREQLLNLSEQSSFTGEVEKRAKELQELLGHNEISHAFQLKSDYEKMMESINSSIHTKDLASLSSALETDFSDYLKPVYNTSLQALDSFKESFELAQANNISDVGEYLHNAEKAILGFKDNSHFLNSAKQLSSIASQMDADIFKSHLESIDPHPVVEQVSDHDEFASGHELARLHNIEIPRFEDSPLGQQNQKLIEHSKKQITVLTDMSNYMLKQTKHVELQNEIMTQQIEASEKTAKDARNWVIVTLIISVVVSAGIYFAQDKSDGKNHQETIKAISDKKLLESQLLQLQAQVANQNKLIELISQQNGYLQYLQVNSMESTDKNQTLKVEQ